MAQKKVIIEKDTLIVITPKNLSTINGVFESWEIQKEEILKQKQIIQVDSALMADQDNMICLLRDQGNELRTENNKLAKKLKITKKGGIVLGILGFLIGILIK